MNECRRIKIEEELNEKQVEELVKQFKSILGWATSYKRMWAKSAAIQMLLFEVEEQIATEHRFEPAMRR